MVKALNFVLLGAFCIGLFTFVVTYLRSNWRANAVGRYIMYLFIALFFIFVYIGMGPIIGYYQGRQFVDLTVLLVINYVVWKIVWLLYKIRKDGEIKDDELSE